MSKKRVGGSAPKRKAINGRAKGCAFEQQVARMFRRWFPQARRGMQFQEGEYCPDIVHTPFYVECKVGSKRLMVGKRQYNPGRDDHWVKMHDYYYKRMGMWRDDNGGEDQTVVFVWKTTAAGQRSGVKVTIPSVAWGDLSGKYFIGTKYFVGIPLVSLDWETFAAALDAVYPTITEKEARDGSAT